MSWFLDALANHNEASALGKLRAQQKMRSNASDTVLGLLGSSPKQAVIAEGFGYGNRPDMQGSGSIGSRLSMPLQEAQAGTGFRGSDMGRGAQTDLLAGLMTEGGLNAQQAYGLLSSELPQELKQDRGMGIFKDPNTYASQLRGFAKDTAAATAPFKQAGLGYMQVKNLMTNENGTLKQIDELDGNFDLVLQRNFMKGMSVLRPEAYMQDDAVQAFMSSQNIGDVVQLKNYFAGDIKLDKKGREKMLKAYNSIMKDNFEALEKIKAPFEKQSSVLFPNTESDVLFGDDIGSYDGGLLQNSYKEVLSPVATGDDKYVNNPQSQLSQELETRRQQLRKMADEEKLGNFPDRYK